MSKIGDSMFFGPKPHVSAADEAARERCTALRQAVATKSNDVAELKAAVGRDLLSRGRRFDDCGWRFTIDRRGEVHVTADPAYVKARALPPYLAPKPRRRADQRRPRVKAA